jgi:phosphoribosylformylglycinamidine synthase
MRNGSLRFVCREVKLKSRTTRRRSPGAYAPRADHPLPGRPPRRATTLPIRRRWRGSGARQVVFRYAEGHQPRTAHRTTSPGIVNAGGNVLGMMPHPENLTDLAQGGLDGLGLFESLAASVLERAA